MNNTPLQLGNTCFQVYKDFKINNKCQVKSSKPKTPWEDYPQRSSQVKQLFDWEWKRFTGSQGKQPLLLEVKKGQHNKKAVFLHFME